MIENAHIAVDYFDHQADLRGMDFLPVKNTTCITLHCSGAIASCLADTNCRTNLECDVGCKGDTACQLSCYYSYQSPNSDLLDSCLFVDHECLSLPPPAPINNATCRNPTETVADIDSDLLDGTWYIVQGFNPIYDCFECQIQTFEVTDGKVNYSALFNMLASNGTEIWPSISMTGEDSSEPGHITYDTTDNGLPDHQTWYVMHLSEDTFVGYYCGNVLD